MGLKNSRPLPQAAEELEMAPFFKRRFRTWHLDHVTLVVERYKALTMRHCIDAIELSKILGIREQPLVEDIMRLFMPKTPTRVHHMIDAMEVVIALILVCQAPSIYRRFEAIFDVIDVNQLGVITPPDLVVLFGAVGRAIMKLFRYSVEPHQRTAILYMQTILESDVGRSGSIEKEGLCKLMISDHYAVHYTKQCTGEGKYKLYFLQEKDMEFLGAVEFHTEEQMKTASLKIIRDMAAEQLYKLPNEFTFLCQGREVKRVWEVDRKGWAIVPFAMRGTPGLRVHTLAHNRRAECPKRPNPFEFRYMGNTLPRYKKKISDVNPIYKHYGFKVSSNNNGKPLTPVVKWRVAENWAGEWIYNQTKLAAPSKTLMQKRLRSAPRAKAERVVVKDHQGRLISPSTEDFADVEPLSRPHTARDPTDNSHMRANIFPVHSPAAMRQRLDRADACERKIRMTARIVAMETLQRLDCPVDFTDEDKENETRRVNSATPCDPIQVRKPDRRTTVLLHINDGQARPSRLMNPKQLLQDRVRSEAHDTSSRLKVSVLPQRLELGTSSTLSGGKVHLGPFLTSSNIELQEDEVEVYPVIVIRPFGDTVDMTGPTELSSRDGDILDTPQVHLRADLSYLSEYEFEIGPHESNFEVVYNHIQAKTSDLITLNRQDIFGRTLLHDAAEYGHSNLMELLLKERVLRNSGDNRGDTPLHHAARRGRLKEVSSLLREGALPWRLNHNGKSALFCALEAAAKSMRRSVISHKRAPEGWNETSSAVRRDVQERNFLATNDRYSRMRQVIDLLWDRYPISALSHPNNADRTSCLQLEHQVFGDVFQACHDGNLVRLQRLIDLDKRATAQYINCQLQILGRTSLHEATEQGHTAIVDLLLKVGADGYIWDQRQEVPLHIATEKGYERIALCLTRKFPGTLALQSYLGKTPLHHATERNHTAVALALIASIKEMDGQTRILDMQDMHGYTPLHYASARANTLVCRSLVEAGASVNISRYENTISIGQKHLLGVYSKRAVAALGVMIVDRRSGGKEIHVSFDLDTPIEILLRASREVIHDYSDRLKLLAMLASEAQRSSRFPRERTKAYSPPLFHLACKVAQTNLAFAVDACKMLSALKYEVNTLHPLSGESVLLQECKRVCNQSVKSDYKTSDLSLIRTLIQIGANPDLPNEKNGETPLSCGAWFGHLALLDLLLEAGSQCNFCSKNSFSALHFAALGKHIACAKLLLGHRSIVNTHVLTPKHDESPLFFAVRSKNERMVQLLLSQGADPCAVCTVQHGVKTSFGIDLSLERSAVRSTTAPHTAPTYGPVKELIDGDTLRVASPLTFTLLVARSVHSYASQAEYVTVDRARKRQEWEVLSRIAIMIAQHAVSTISPSGSTGSSLVTRHDIYLSCFLGYWELARLLLAQQIVLPSASTSSRMNALHLAAAAGESTIVTALVAAGMNVNCRLAHPNIQVVDKQDLRFGRTTRLVKYRGALFFALVNGHVETAARLLVLGANPLETLPHDAITHAKTRYICLKVHESMPKTRRDRFFASREQGPRSGEQSHSTGFDNHERIMINFVRLLETSINAKLPLLHCSSGMGYRSMVELLVGAGMSFSTSIAPSVEWKHMQWRWEWYAETAIHVAILRGHLQVLQYFASQVQFNFPRFFSREDRRPRSLLLLACLVKRVDIVNYLISSGAVGDAGGGYNMENTADDLEHAMNCCALGQFVEGFRLLLQEGTQPDILTLSKTLEGIERAHGFDELVGDFAPSVTEVFTSSRVPSRYRNKKRVFAPALALLNEIGPFAKDPDRFFRVLSFDQALTTFIMCSQYGLWTIFRDVFLVNEVYFIQPLNPWKNLLVRAANCCMILHRAAIADQVDVLRFFVSLGVTPDLKLPEVPQLSCPVRFAARHHALQAFLFLSLQSADLGVSLDLKRLPPPHIHHRSIECSSSFLALSSGCRWQNLSVMSCYEVSRSRQAPYMIQTIINLWIAESKKPNGNSLLHLACGRAHPVLVELLINAGARISALNSSQETPLMIAAKRKDLLGVAVVRYLISAMPKPETEFDAADHTVILSRALVSCFAQAPLCNLKTAKILLAAGADANFQDLQSDSLEQSAMYHALRSAQFAGVKLLLDNGAKLSQSFSDVFLSPLQVVNGTLKTHWRRFSSYLKHNGQRLLEVESLMNLLLEKRYSQICLNEDLLHEMLNAAAAIAATAAKWSNQEERFWAICTRILQEHSREISSRKTVWGRRSALHYAVECLEVEVVRQLVSLHLCDVDAEDERKRTPLHLVAIKGDYAICDLLINKLDDKTRIDCMDGKGRTPLHLAIVYGHEQVVAQLLQHGASMRMRCSRGYNAHLYAASLNRVAMMITLFDRDSSRDLLYTSSGEFALFLAARNASFRIVRWFATMTADMRYGLNTNSLTHTASCTKYNRTILHYAAMFGDAGIVKEILSAGISSTIIDSPDCAGYTALMYSFAFGKIDVTQLLLEAGADPTIGVDHSTEAKTHPYACQFTIASLGEWFVLPGWLSFVSKSSPTQKRSLVEPSLSEHYFYTSGYRLRFLRTPIKTGRYGRDLPRTAKRVVVRTSLRAWNYRTSSFFEFACEVGDEKLIDLLCHLPLPGMIRHPSLYAVLRRGFLQAVQWNRVKIVKQLLTLPTSGSAITSSGINMTSGDVKFADFLEVAVDCAVSRGLEEMTILLLSEWHGIKENGRIGGDTSAFAFQFAQAFQVACIRGLADVVRYMITRGSEEIVAFHWNDGPSLVYAFAFGHNIISSILLEHGAHISTMDTYIAPSFKKWIEFGCPSDVQVQWYELSSARTMIQALNSQLPLFVGPLETYEPPHDRLDAEAMASMFLLHNEEVADVKEVASEDVRITTGIEELSIEEPPSEHMNRE